MSGKDLDSLSDRIDVSLKSGFSAITRWFTCARCGKPYPMREVHKQLQVHSPLCWQCKVTPRNASHG
jgi:hypothetical protein